MRCLGGPISVRTLLVYTDRDRLQDGKAALTSIHFTLFRGSPLTEGSPPFHGRLSTRRVYRYDGCIYSMVRDGYTETNMKGMSRRNRNANRTS
jgi:hypothetical protein